jgi:hypothetical protein
LFGCFCFLEEKKTSEKKRTVFERGVAIEVTRDCWRRDKGPGVGQLGQFAAELRQPDRDPACLRPATSRENRSLARKLACVCLVSWLIPFRHLTIHSTWAALRLFVAEAISNGRTINHHYFLYLRMRGPRPPFSKRPLKKEERSPGRLTNVLE